MKLIPFRLLTRMAIFGAILMMHSGCSDEVRGDEYVRLSKEEIAQNRALYLEHQAALKKGWDAYKGAFVRNDGRVIDTHSGVTHSEGQSYAMLVATYVDDRETFDQVWNWTQDNLRVRGDNLFAWRYLPGTDASGSHIPDKNNASDGDIAIAWALIRASQLWNEPRYRDEAALILDDLRAQMIVPQSGRFLLLPGADGFQKEGETTVNLSYYLYPAFEVFAVEDTEPDLWRMLIEEGLRLTDESLLGEQQLPTDWVTVGDESVKPGANWDNVFSYDAIRLPLYLFWGGKLKQTPKFHISLQMTWRRVEAERFPARVPVFEELKPTDGETALHGMRQVYEMATQPAAAVMYAQPDPDGILAINEGYYSSSLALLVGCARLDALERGY